MYSTANKTMKQAENKKWNDFLKEQKMISPKEMINMRQSSKIWTLIDTETAYSYGQGAYFISMLFAFWMFIKATKNW